ncbi:MAG: class I SAM-dependent methyltransferase [Myxococcaceae bacterium]
MPWDLVAAAYEAEVLPQFEHFAREALRLAAPPPGARVADVACGPGTLALLAARAGFAVDAVDFSTEMVERLERRLRSESIQRVTARVGDGQALPLADGGYSGAFSMFGLMFFADRARGFAELRRILAPGARAVVSSWQPLETVPAMAAMFGALRDALSGTFGQSGAPEQREMPLTTPEACRVEMGRSFVDVEVHPASNVVDYSSVEALWASMERSMAPIVLMRRGLGERWAPLARAARTAMAKVLGDGPVTLTMSAWLTVGVAGT